MVISILVALSLDFMTGRLVCIGCGVCGALPTSTIGRLQHARAAYDAMGTGIGAWPAMAAGAAARDERARGRGSAVWWPWAYRSPLTGN